MQQSSTKELIEPMEPMEHNDELVSLLVQICAFTEEQTQILKDTPNLYVELVKKQKESRVLRVEMKKLRSDVEQKRKTGAPKCKDGGGGHGRAQKPKIM